MLQWKDQLLFTQTIPRKTPFPWGVLSQNNRDEMRAIIFYYYFVFGLIQCDRASRDHTCVYIVQPTFLTLRVACSGWEGWFFPYNLPEKWSHIFCVFPFLLELVACGGKTTHTHAPCKPRYTLHSIFSLCINYINHTTSLFIKPRNSA